MASVYKRTWTGQDGRERVRWVAAYKDQQGRRHNKGFRSRKDAKAFLVLTEGEIVRGVHSPESTSITVAEAARLWLKRGELEQLERSTMRQYRNHVDHHILPLIGAVKLARLSTPVVQLFRDKLLETRSRALARKVLASLKSIIGEAMRRGLVAQNCAAPVSIDSKKREAGKLEVGVDIPSLADVNLLIERAEGRWRRFFVTAVFTGMRASELRGLVWDAVISTEKRSPCVSAPTCGAAWPAKVSRRRAGDPDGADGRQCATRVAARLPQGPAWAGLSQWQRQCREPCQHRCPRLRAVG